MKTINIYPLSDSGILYIYSIKDVIEINPDYQRMGGVWNVEKRQLLIDSIINGLDIPKIYFHKFPKPKTIKSPSRTIKYAIIDGRQRLESIWGFIDGEFNLDDGFEYFDDKSIRAGGLGYADLSKEYPQLKLIFDQKSLPIICVETNNMDLIEEMFSRLNEAVPLNAAEKRNAFGGPMAKGIRDISFHDFFKNNIPFSNNRYQHREVSAKFLLLDYSNKISDTKKAFLDRFVLDFKNKEIKSSQIIVDRVSGILDRMNKIFIKKDPLLKTQGMVVLYFLLYRNLSDQGWFNKLSRKAFLDFEQLRLKNRKMAEIDLAKANFSLLEFDRYSSQGTNDGPSIRYRSEIINEYLKNYPSNINKFYETYD